MEAGPSGDPPALIELWVMATPQAMTQRDILPWEAEGRNIGDEPSWKMLPGRAWGGHQEAPS